MKKILITGAKGFIGSNLCELMRDKGFNVIGWDRVASSSGIVIKKVDMSSYDEIIAELKNDLPDVVIHCAGNADVGKSVLYPNEDYIGNVGVTHNLLFALYNIGLKNCKVIFLSSAAVYGTPKSLPISETFELNPLSPYALHKVMAEKVCLYFYKNYNMNIKIVRIFSAYGVGLRKQIFWDMYKKVTEVGSLLMFGSGEESRDYINITDLKEAIFLVTTKAPKEEIIYNIANGVETKIKTIVYKFANYYGIDKDKVIFSGKNRQGDPINWMADISKLKSLGYTQQINISDGIKSYVDWVKRV